MTRDEAIGIIHGVTYPETANKTNGEACSGDFARDRKLSIRVVDGLAALGVLKLDEPKRAADKLRDELVSRGYGYGWANLVEKAMEATNLKLVEK